MSKISELSDGGALQSTDYLIAVRSGGNVKVQPAGMTFSSATFTTVDINGGTIDGVTIGGSSAGAITGTTGQFNTSLNVDGTVTADGLTVENNTGSKITLSSTDLAISSGEIIGEIDFYSSDQSGIGAATRAKIITLAADAAGAGDVFIKTSTGASTALDRLKIANNGDISFYEDTGTTPKFFWDASAESLGIGTTSPDGGIDIAKAQNSTNQFTLPHLALTATATTDTTGFTGISYASSTVANYGWTAGALRSTTGNNASFVFNVHNNSASGTERMRIDSSGNVGIGTSSPSSVLHLSTSNDPKITLTDTGFGASADITGSNGNLRLNSQTATIFDMADSEVARIDSSGNVGIGTSSPGNLLHVSGSGNVAKFETSSSGGIDFSRTTAVGNNSGHFGLSFINADSTVASFQTINRTGGTTSTGTGYELRTSAVGTGYLSYYTNGSEAARIDSSGNLLVGKTSTDFGVAGINLEPGGNLGITRSSSAPINANRLASDGDIVKFYKDSVTVGSIGTVAAGAADQLYIVSDDVGLRFRGSDDSIVPVTSAGAFRDNAIDFGLSTARFDDIYATNGTIQTSDANEKENIRELLETEARVAQAAKGLLRAFQWKDSVAEKGDDARIHFGIIAQDLQAAFEAEGLDAGRYAMFIHSTWTDEETGEERSRMGVRYSELLAFIIAAL